jgi:hypothetical protein
VNIQFLGYQQMLTTRVYGFRVINTLQQERMFELSIGNQLLEDNKFKIQDIPDLCFARLKSELSIESEENVLPLDMSVTDAELKKYIEVHYPSKVRRGTPFKPQS